MLFVSIILGHLLALQNVKRQLETFKTVNPVFFIIDG